MKLKKNIYLQLKKRNNSVEYFYFFWELNYENSYYLKKIVMDL